MTKGCITGVIFTLLSHLVLAQNNPVSIEFKPVYGSLPFELNKKYPYQTDSIEMSMLKFYISNIQFYYNDILIDTASKKYHLANAEDPITLLLHSNANKKFNHLRFCIGIDSITNTSGAMGGDLDPTSGMYWTWQSGYINFKMEGYSKLCPGRKNEFTFHIGGYQYPYNSLQQVDIPAGNSKKIIIAFDIAKLLNEIKLADIYDVMSPGEKAMTIAQKIKTAFHSE